MSDWPFLLASELDVDLLCDTLASPSRSDVEIVVPVYNGGPAVCQSISAMLRHRPEGVRLVVVDDASDDPLTVDFLDEMADRGAIELRRHEVNAGYTATVNEAIESSSGDVLLMNSDAHPGPFWVQRMRWVAYSSPRVGTVSAVSDFAGSMGLPMPHEKNAWNERLGWDSVARLVAHATLVWSQQTPTAHGFCLYLTRDAIDEIGVFDGDAFPRGYGEEVDFAQRVLRSGRVNLIAPHVMVKHYRSQSFGADARQQLNQASKPVLRRRYPELERSLVDWDLSLGNALIRSGARRLIDRDMWSYVGSRDLVVRCTCSVRPQAETERHLDARHDGLALDVDDVTTATDVAKCVIEAGAESILYSACDRHSVVREAAAALMVPFRR